MVSLSSHSSVHVWRFFPRCPSVVSVASCSRSYGYCTQILSLNTLVTAPILRLREMNGLNCIVCQTITPRPIFSMVGVELSSRGTLAVSILCMCMYQDHSDNLWKPQGSIGYIRALWVLT